MWEKLLEILIKNPMAIYIVLTGVFGWLYYTQNAELRQMTGEVSGLRVEISKMNEIIALKVKLACEECSKKGL